MPVPLECNSWLREQLKSLKSGETEWSLFGEWKKRHAEETGRELSDPRKTFKQACERVTSGGHRWGI